MGWHGREKGTVCLKERKLRVKRPRWRKKGQGEDGSALMHRGEVPIPAYEAMRSDEKLGSRMLEIQLRGGRSRVETQEAARDLLPYFHGCVNNLQCQ